jgi:putative FmdB family regulatory protein
MPIYEYECRKCKAHVEILQKITDAPLAKCRKCGGKLEKQWSAAGFQFKGTGWYVTDYAGKKREGAEEKKGSPAEASTASSSSTDKAAPAATEKATPSKSASGKKAATSKNSTGD